MLKQEVKNQQMLKQKVKRLIAKIRGQDKETKSRD